MIYYDFLSFLFVLFVCVQTVAARSEKSGEEEKRCKQLADNAQRDLDAALPALEAAVKVSWV